MEVWKVSECEGYCVVNRLCYGKERKVESMRTIMRERERKNYERREAKRKVIRQGAMTGKENKNGKELLKQSGWERQ